MGTYQWCKDNAVPVPWKLYDAVHACQRSRYNRVQGISVNKRLMVAVLVGSFGGFVFGFDLGALSAATESLRAEFALSPWAFGVTVSASIWGTVAGAILAGRFADGSDRRSLIAWSALLYTVSAIGVTMPVPSGWLLVLAMRFLCGMAIGGFTVGCPLYLSEVAPIAMRGRVVGMFQLQVGAGVIAAFSTGALIVHDVPSGAAWKWILGLGALPSFALLFLTRLMPEVEDGVTRSDHKQFAVKIPSQRDECADQRLFVRRNARLILLATSIAVFNQLSGVNILLLYMLEILASAGVNFSLGHTYTVLVSGLSLVTTMLGMAFVDRLGRKPLLYLGSFGMAGCLVALGLAIPHHFNPVIYLSLLIAYNAFFAISQGTVVWVYLSELFPLGLRGSGQGYGSTVHWIANALLISVFPSVQHASSVRFFYIFALMMVVQLGVICVWYPETKGTALGTFAISEEGRLH
jgi:MFS family permease